MNLPAESDAPPLGRIRDLLVRLSCALLAVVLLKWFCLEAYRIPSPSMQPTLLGSVEAGVHDQVLVDKLRYLLAEPARWDLAVFHAPLQQRDTFVKRIVGLPGERIAIAGGNLHVVEGGPGAERLRVLRRPPALQEAQWREVLPARSLARGETPALGGALRGEPAAAWHTDLPDLVAELAPDRPTRLVWADADGGLVDRPWDGHPLAVARTLRAVHAQQSHRAEVTADARILVRLQASAAPSRCALAIDVWRPGLPSLRFAFEYAGGTARLVVARDGVPAAASAPVAFPWREGATTTICFAHVDDELMAWHDGVEIARFDGSAFPCREGCELPDPCGMGPAMPGPTQRAEASLEFAGAGVVRVQEVRIWRDQQWTRGPLAAGTVLVVPADHYLLLGDNPLQSEDGRGWQAIPLGVLADSAVPPDTPGAVVRVGSLQLGRRDEAPGRDENPVCLDDRHLLVLRDRLGNRDVLHGDLGPDDGGTGLRLGFRGMDGIARKQQLAATTVHFVPRADLLGRAMLRYWPLPPFGPWRAGWLR